MLRDTHSGFGRLAALVLRFPMTAYILAVGVGIGIMAAKAVADPTVSPAIAGLVISLAVLCIMVMAPLMLAIEHGWHMPDPSLEPGATDWPAEAGGNSNHRSPAGACPLAAPDARSTA